MLLIRLIPPVFIGLTACYLIVQIFRVVNSTLVGLG